VEDKPLKILLTGSTGYIGGRLLKRLEREEFKLRCITRNRDFLESRLNPSTEVFEADLLDPESLTGAFESIDIAFYLVHSMGSSGDFRDQDREAARNFISEAKSAGVKRIIYLGGLGQGSSLSSHLKSRHEVGEILRESGIITVELRASIIIGSGSLSFEMIRSLVNRLPIMITPSWVRVRAQPIAIEDVLDYLIESIQVPLQQSEVFEIGGSDQVSYQDILKEYARQRKLRRLIIPVPVLTPNLSSLWLGLITPVYARIGQKLISSVKNETTVSDNRALKFFKVRPRGIAESIQRALINEDQEFAETRWCDALSSSGEQSSYGGVKWRNRLVDSREETVDFLPQEAFQPIQMIGGNTGWYFANWLWNIRGFLDLLAGGVGVRRGRKHPVHIGKGDAIDFWRVEEFEPSRLLRLKAEMKLPGRAWLQFEVEPVNDKQSRVRQTAVFDPLGLSGLTYWYGLFPFHKFLFSGMLKNIVKQMKSKDETKQLEA
jgi:uncharacterized protein YbjT (DUF2867 family)